MEDGYNGSVQLFDCNKFFQEKIPVVFLISLSPSLFCPAYFVSSWWCFKGHSVFSSNFQVIVNMLIKKCTPPWHFPLLSTLLGYLIVSRLSGLGRKLQFTIAQNYFDLPSGEIWHLNYISFHESVSDLGSGAPVNLFASQIACKKTMVWMSQTTDYLDLAK